MYTHLWPSDSPRCLFIASGKFLKALSCHFQNLHNPNSVLCIRIHTKAKTGCTSKTPIIVSTKVVSRFSLNQNYRILYKEILTWVRNGGAGVSDVALRRPSIKFPIVHATFLCAVREHFFPC